MQSYKYIHERWISLAAALRESGVAAELTNDYLQQKLGTKASRPPEPHAFATLLDVYFRGDGDTLLGLTRKENVRLFVHDETHRVTAHHLLTTVSRSTPELCDISLQVGTSARKLSLWANGMVTLVDEEDIFIDSIEIDGIRHRRRTVSVSGLISAVNRILAVHQLTYRFVPLLTPNNVAIYVGVTALAAAQLETGGALSDSWDELTKMMSWNPSDVALLTKVA